MSWAILVAAGFCEAAFAFCLGKAKLATGWHVYGWYAGFALTLLLSMALLMKAVQTIPIGTAYAVWTGIGAATTALLGIIVFHEPATFWRLFFLLTLIASVVGLKRFAQ